MSNKFTMIIIITFIIIVYIGTGCSVISPKFPCNIKQIQANELSSIPPEIFKLT